MMNCVCLFVCLLVSGDRNWYAASQCLEVEITRISFPTSSSALSVKSGTGVPRRQKTCSTNILAMVLASLFGSGNASAHLEKASTHVRIYLEPRTVLGCGPVMSTWHLSITLPVSIG